MGDRVLSDGGLAVTVPGDWRVVEGTEEEGELFDGVQLIAMATGEGDERSSPAAVLVSSDEGDAMWLAETLFAQEAEGRAMSEGAFPPPVGQDVSWRGLSAYRLTGTVSDHLIDGPDFRVEVLVVPAAAVQTDTPGQPPVDRLSALVTCCPLNDPEALAVVARLWSDVIEEELAPIVIPTASVPGRVVVDEAALDARRRKLARYRAKGVDLWVVVDGLSRWESFEAVRAACAEWGPDVWREVFPTAGGTMVELAANDWKLRVARLAEVLQALGRPVTITAPPFTTERPAFTRDLAPGMWMAHRMDPPITAGPFAPNGVPVFRWTVPGPAHQRLLRRAVDWVLLPQGVGSVRSIPPVRVTAEDAQDVLNVFENGTGNTFVGWSADHSVLRRCVSFRWWGQGVWFDADPSTSRTSRAENMAEVLVELADDLHHGFLRVELPSDYELLDAPGDLDWGHAAHLWGDYVQDAYGIQLVTGSQIDKARDLSTWQVRKISPDRYLISARNLPDWFECNDPMALYSDPDWFSSPRTATFPDPTLRAQARHDFGDMILTNDIVRTHPNPPE